MRFFCDLEERNVWRAAKPGDTIDLTGEVLTQLMVILREAIELAKLNWPK